MDGNDDNYIANDDVLLYRVCATYGSGLLRLTNNVQSLINTQNYYAVPPWAAGSESRNALDNFFF